MKRGDILPSFNLEGIDNNWYSTDDFLKKKIFCIIFSCNYCPYVLAYLDRIINIYDKYENEDFALWLINSNDPVKYPQDSFENMKEMATKKSFKFPYLFDKTQKIAKKFKAERTPEVFLFNKRKVLVYHGGIDDNWEKESKVIHSFLAEAIKKLVQEEDIVVVETPVEGCSIKWKNK
ncbi:thioredoxin family protein [Bacteroidales bacterium AH-315-N07]|nr:thioredoxin family protein [Bacteroidales bacterium AH-315-N07]